MNCALESVAAALLRAEADAKGYRADLLLRMEIEGVKRVDVPGTGFVSYVAASTSHPIDGKACAARVGELAGRLRQMGVTDPDLDAIPLGTSDRSASVRCTLKAAA